MFIISWWQAVRSEWPFIILVLNCRTLELQSRTPHLIKYNIMPSDRI